MSKKPFPWENCPMNLSTHKKVFLALICASLIWGATAPIMKFTLASVPIFSLAFIRFATAALILFPFVINKLTIKKEDWPIVVFSAICCVTFNIGFFFLGLKLTTALNAGIIIASTPLFTALFAHLFLKEKIAQNLIFGALAGFIGIAIIISKDFFSNGFYLSPLGDFLILLAMLSFVFYEIAGKKLASHNNNPLSVTFYSFGIGALTFLPAAALELQKNPDWVASLKIPAVLGILYGILFSSLLAYSLWEWGLSKIPAARVGFFFYLDPIAATIVAVLLLGEKITPLFILGSLFIFLGLFLAERRLPYQGTKN